MVITETDLQQLEEWRQRKQSFMEQHKKITVEIDILSKDYEDACLKAYSGDLQAKEQVIIYRKRAIDAKNQRGEIEFVTLRACQEINRLEKRDQ